jgi:hypothetical protein
MLLPPSSPITLTSSTNGVNRNHTDALAPSDRFSSASHLMPVIYSLTPKAMYWLSGTNVVLCIHVLTIPGEFFLFYHVHVFNAALQRR